MGHSEHKTGVGILISVLALVASACSPLPSSAEANGSDSDLASALDRAVSSVSIPTGWETEVVPIDSYADGIGYRSSDDFSSSGTWMLISLSPAVMSEDGSSPEDRFWGFIENTETEGQLGFVHEPTATEASGVNGYRYELSGGIGDKTGQPLGGHLAIFFGSEYTYEVLIQFEIPDRDDMRALFNETLKRLTLADSEEFP